jgi:hypothetical protein
MHTILDLVQTGVPPLDTTVLFWRGDWLIGQVFISKKGKRLFTDGGFPVGPKSRWILLPRLEPKKEWKPEQ